MRRLVVLLVLFVCVLIVAACGRAQEQDDTGDSNYPITPCQMQHDPMSFTGRIAVMGTVGSYGRFNFSLSSEDGDFELAIDYRGNQALPEVGTVIIAIGRMHYRSCCGPHLIATSFEEA